MSKLIQEDKTYVANTYRRFPVELVSGKGALAYGSDGKEYIDLGSGIAVNTFGFADSPWQAAVTEQLGKLQHTSNLYYTEPCVRLARMLCEKTGMKKVFFSNSGAEANECAIKVARKYAAEHQGADHYTIVTLVNSFHGRTLTTLAATGQEHFHTLFQPLTPGFIHIPANDFNALTEALKAHKVAGILVECVQGEGGVLPLKPDYARFLEKTAKEQDILLMIDEVQTGNGRTGALYAYMNLGLHPDVVTTAKGLGGGLPLGATLLSEKVENVLGFGDHGSTFGGNPVACAGAISILERLSPELLKDVQKKSAYIFGTLTGAPGIKNVSGMGLMIGVTPCGDAGKIVGKCIEKGVLCLTAKEKVRLLPPLNIPMPLLEKAIGILKSVCEEEQE